MTKNNSNTFSRPEPFSFDIKESVEELYSHADPLSAVKTDDANSMDSEKNGNKGDIVFGKNSKGKDVLAIHNGIEWKYCVTYSSRELKDLDSKYRMLEKKVLNLALGTHN